MQPKNWLSNLHYKNFLDYTGVKISKKPFIEGVEIRRINNISHPVNNHFGLYATKEWEPIEIVGQYTGELKTGDVGGRYVASITPYTTHSLYHIDAENIGNEMRFINDYRGISSEPNVKLTSTFIDRLPRVIVITIKPIHIDEELLLDYGEDYWKCYHT